MGEVTQQHMGNRTSAVADSRSAAHGFQPWHWPELGRHCAVRLRRRFPRISPLSPLEVPLGSNLFFFLFCPLVPLLRNSKPSCNQLEQGPSPLSRLLPTHRCRSRCRSSDDIAGVFSPHHGAASPSNFVFGGIVSVSDSTACCEKYCVA